MAGFSGKYYYSLDPKGRVMVPAAFREMLSANFSQKLVITVALFDPCLHIFPYEEWSRFLDKAKGLPKSRPAVQLLLRKVVGSAMESELDRQGRLLVPASLRQDASLKEEIVVVGIVDRIELWDKELWQKATDVSAVDKQAILAELGDLGV